MRQAYRPPTSTGRRLQHPLVEASVFYVLRCRLRFMRRRLVHDQTNVVALAELLDRRGVDLLPDGLQQL